MGHPAIRIQDFDKDKHDVGLPRMMNMNCHERRYRWTGRALIVLLGLWVAAMLLAMALPAAVWKLSATPLIFFVGVFPILLGAAIVLGVMRMVAYIRWTGKYPYYFLFGKAHGSGDDVKKGEKGSRPETGSSV